MRAGSMLSHLRGAPHARMQALFDQRATAEAVLEKQLDQEKEKEKEKNRVLETRRREWEAQREEKRREEVMRIDAERRAAKEVEENKKREMEEMRRRWEAEREGRRRAEVRRGEEERKKLEEERVKLEGEKVKMQEEMVRRQEKEEKMKWEKMERDLRRAQEVLERAAEEKRAAEERKCEEKRVGEEKQAEENLRKAQEDLIQSASIGNTEHPADESDSTQNTGGHLQAGDDKPKKPRKKILTAAEKQTKRQVEDDLRNVQEEMIRKMETEDAAQAIQTKEKEEEADRAVFRENAAAADEQLRLAQDRLRREWVTKLRTAAAAAADAEVWRKQEAQRAEEQAARFLADQEQIEMENRRRQAEEYEQQEAERQAIEQEGLIYSPGEQSGITHSSSSPSGSISMMGFFQQGGPSTQTLHRATGLIDPAAEAAILRYLQWQSIIQEMQQQEVWLQQPLVL